VGLGATTVVRLEGALAHSGAPGINRRVTNCGLAVTVRPRDLPSYLGNPARIPRPAGFRAIHGARAARHLEAGVTRGHAAAAIDNSTSLRYAAGDPRVKPAAHPAAAHSLWTTT
jgi:hypothetical protein